jgi:Zn-dependent membrane protease YugP
MPYFYFDWTYLLLLPGMLLAFWAQHKVKAAYRDCSRVYSSSGLTGADVAQRILRDNGIFNVRVEPIHGELNDHYDPRAGVIRLSDGVYGARSAAAIGVAAHEAGHAVQYAKNYLPIKLRAAIVPVANIGSRLAFPMFLIGLLLTGVAQYSTALFGYYLALAGIAAYALTTLFQLVTLPVELNASRRAMKALEGMYLRGEELQASRQMLSAAALTYVAALATSLLSLLRLLVILGGRDRR